MMRRPKTPMDYDQLVFMVEVILAGVWDRIESMLPECAEHAGEMDDWNDNKPERRQLIDAHVSVVAATLPILYAQMMDDGMGVGEFAQFDTFELQVKDFVRRKTDPKINRRGTHIRHPDTHELASHYVQDYLGQYPPL